MFVCCSTSVFFFKQKTAYEMRISDWSSDVCSSDLCRWFRCSAKEVQSVTAGMTEAAGAALAGSQVIDDFECGPHDRHEHHLCDTLAGIDRERRLATGPARTHPLPLVIGVAHTNQIADHDTAFLAHPRPRPEPPPPAPAAPRKPNAV